jgi:hypothetical protein
VWVATFLVALMRALPFLRTQLVRPESSGTVPLPIGYIPKDWLAYAALVRQGSESGSMLLVNPFTTEVQGGRLILLFHQALHLVFRLTGIDPFLLLELSRPVLLAGFVLVLWWFLGLVLAEEQDRVWACWLVLLSGGFGFVLDGHTDLFPPPVALTVSQDLWILSGWSTFESLFNPLWISGLTLQLIVLGTLLRPGGPATVRIGGLGSLAFLVLWFTHVYSAVATLVILAGAFVAEWSLTDRPDWAALGRRSMALAPALLFILPITAWQMQDSVFRASSGGVVGSQSVAVFWYPLTLGALGFFALRGMKSWLLGRHPWRYSMLAWIGSVALLHSSPIVNGYKFLLYLHLPVCIVAASAVAAVVSGQRAGGVQKAAIVLLLFASSIAVTGLSVLVAGDHAVPEPVARLVGRLARLPPGNVLAPPDIGNLVPAFGPHRVYVGQWFMTPAYTERSGDYEKMVQNPSSGLLDGVIASERVAYLVAPVSQAAPLATWAGTPGEVFGDWILLVLPARHDGAPASAARPRNDSSSVK